MLGVMLTHWTMGDSAKEVIHGTTEGRTVQCSGNLSQREQSSRFLLMELFPNVLGRGNFDIPNEHLIYGDLGT